MNDRDRFVITDTSPGPGERYYKGVHFDGERSWPRWVETQKDATKFDQKISAEKVAGRIVRNLGVASVAVVPFEPGA